MDKISRVICVLFDATNKDTAFSSEVQMPTLRALREEGLFIHSKTVLPSNSVCARSAAFSGSYPLVSGILSHDPAETVFDVASKCGYITIISGGWEGDASLNSRGSVSVFNAPTSETISDMRFVKDKNGEFTSSYVVDLACRFIKENPEFKILFTDFLDSDCVGHRFKETSSEYRCTLEYEDQQLERLLKEAEKQKLLEETLWIIFTDHAMVNGTHGGVDAIDTWIILYAHSLPEYARGKETVGTILDICPTICEALKLRRPHKCKATSLLERVTP